MDTEEQIKETFKKVVIGVLATVVIIIVIILLFLGIAICLCVKIRRMGKLLDSHASLLQSRGSAPQHNEDLSKRYVMSNQQPYVQHSEHKKNEYPSLPNFPPRPPPSNILRGENENNRYGPSRAHNPRKVDQLYY